MNYLSDLIYKLTPDLIINIININEKARFLRLTDPDLILMCCGIVVFAGFNFSLNKIYTFRQKSPEAHILERAEDRMN